MHFPRALRCVPGPKKKKMHEVHDTVMRLHTAAEVFSVQVPAKVSQWAGTVANSFETPEFSKRLFALITY